MQRIKKQETLQARYLYQGNKETSESSQLKVLRSWYEITRKYVRGRGHHELWLEHENCNLTFPPPPPTTKIIKIQQIMECHKEIKTRPSEKLFGPTQAPQDQRSSGVPLDQEPTSTASRRSG